MKPELFNLLSICSLLIVGNTFAQPAPPTKLGAVAKTANLAPVINPVGKRGEVTITWSASDDPATVGYRIAWGTNAAALSTGTQIGKLTSFTAKGLVEGYTNHFSLTSVDDKARESDPPLRVSVLVPTGISFINYSYMAEANLMPGTWVWMRATNLTASTVWIPFRTNVVTTTSRVSVLVTNTVTNQFITVIKR